mgnify:CR=1 FL=1
MHSWAQFMEKLSGHLGENFKQDGTSPIQDLGRTLSLFYSASEEGRSIDNELSSTLDRQLAAVEKLLERPTK